MKCVFIYLLFLGLVLSSALPATEVDNEIEKRDYPFYDQIGQVASNSDVWGPTVLWAGVIFNSIGVAAAVADAVNWCISNDAAGPDARSACIGAMKAAAQRATLVVAIVVGGTNLSGSSSKREDRVSAVEEALSQARHSYGSHLKLIDVGPTIATQDFSEDYEEDYIVQDMSSNNTYIRVVNRNGNFGGYEFNDLDSHLKKRAETCEQPKHCSTSETQYFGPYSIMVDMCKDSNFNMINGNGDWLNTMLDMLGSTNSASYFKMYTSTSQWDMSWRVYSGSYEYWWSECDTGS